MFQSVCSNSYCSENGVPTTRSYAQVFGTNRPRAITSDAPVNIESSVEFPWGELPPSNSVQPPLVPLVEEQHSEDNWSQPQFEFEQRERANNNNNIWKDANQVLQGWGSPLPLGHIILVVGIGVVAIVILYKPIWWIISCLIRTNTIKNYLVRGVAASHAGWQNAVSSQVKIMSQALQLAMESCGIQKEHINNMNAARQDVLNNIRSNGLSRKYQLFLAAKEASLIEILNIDTDIYNSVAKIAENAEYKVLEAKNLYAQAGIDNTSSVGIFLRILFGQGDHVDKYLHSLGGYHNNNRSNN